MVEYTEYTKAPPLESGSKDTVIPTITREGGNCIDRCITIAIGLAANNRPHKPEYACV